MATQKEIAEHIDLSTRQVRTLLKSGILPSGSGAGGLDLDACRLAYVRYIRGKATGRVVEAASELDPQQERARLTFHQANLAALEERHRTDELIEISQAAEVFGAECANIRARLLALPHKVAPELAVETDTAKVFSTLQEHIYDALRELSSDEEAQRRVREYEARKSATA